MIIFIIYLWWIISTHFPPASDVSFASSRWAQKKNPRSRPCRSQRLWCPGRCHGRTTAKKSLDPKQWAIVCFEKSKIWRVPDLFFCFSMFVFLCRCWSRMDRRTVEEMLNFLTNKPCHGFRPPIYERGWLLYATAVGCLVPWNIIYIYTQYIYLTWL